MNFESAFLGPQSIQVCHLRSKTPLTSVDCLCGPPYRSNVDCIFAHHPSQAEPSSILPHPFISSAPAPPGRCSPATRLPPRALAMGAPAPSPRRPWARPSSLPPPASAPRRRGLSPPPSPRRPGPPPPPSPRRPRDAPPPAGSARGATLPRPRQRGPSSGRLSGRRPWRVMARPWQRRPLLPPSPFPSLLPPSPSPSRSSSRGAGGRAGRRRGPCSVASRAGHTRRAGERPPCSRRAVSRAAPPHLELAHALAPAARRRCGRRRCQRGGGGPPSAPARRESSEGARPSQAAEPRGGAPAKAGGGATGSPPRR